MFQISISKICFHKKYKHKQTTKNMSSPLLFPKNKRQNNNNNNCFAYKAKNNYHPVKGCNFTTFRLQGKYPKIKIVLRITKVHLNNRFKQTPKPQLPPHLWISIAIFLAPIMRWWLNTTQPTIENICVYARVHHLFKTRNTKPIRLHVFL